MSRHILAVDDDTLLRRSLAFNLEKAGYRVSTAGNAEDALAIVQIDLPDLVILDIGLPGMDGMDALRKLRQQMQCRLYSLQPVVVNWMKSWVWN